MGRSWDLFGSIFWALGRPLASFLEALRVPGATFLSRFVVQRSVQSENSDMLDFDDPLNGFAMFLRSQGLQDWVKMGAGHLKCRWAMGYGLRATEYGICTMGFDGPGRG